MTRTINYLSGDEKIAITGNLETGYFVFYGIHRSKALDRWVYSSSAGRFKTFLAAHRALKKHRPTAHVSAAIEWEIAE